MSSTSDRITKALLTELENDPHIEGLKLTIPLLEKIIIKAITAYYNTDKPILTDNTYDILETILKEKKPDSKAFEKVGAPVPTADAVKLPYYLGSLDKVKPGERVLTRWLESHKGSILISEKLDGLSSLLIIEPTSGNTDLTMKLFKHGDGYEGQDISHLLQYLNIGGNIRKNALIEYINSTPKKQLALRGEIIIKTATYSAKYTKLYPKARSLIAGVVNSKTVDAAIAKDMEIVFYELINPDGLKFSDQFTKISQLGFNLALNKLYSMINEKDLPEILLEFKKNSKYEIDGIILSDDSKAHSRATEKNPKYSVAFKMLLDDQVATTKVINVEYNVSKHGFLVPRIQYEPVVIKGDTHQYTSGFHARYIQDNKIGPGAVIQIVKSGDVIPYIYQVVTPAKSPQMPSATGVKWHWDNSGLEAVLDNIEENEDVLEKRIINFFEVMKIAGVGPGNVAKLIAAGYDDTQKILSLTPDVIAQVEGFQLKSATNLYNSIQKVISVEQPLERVMAASNTFGVGMGERKMGALLSALPNFLEKWKSGKIGKNDIMQVEGFSDKTADLVIEGMPRFLSWLEMHKMLKFNGVKKVVEATSNKFAGMVVVFTGVRDAEMEKRIVEGGGEIGSGVSKKTTLVVAKDVGESSSKITKAIDMGIQVVSYAEFKSKYT